VERHADPVRRRDDRQHAQGAGRDRAAAAHVQVEYNERNGITPQSIVKPIDMSLVAVAEGDYVTVPLDVPCRRWTPSTPAIWY
jgi:hypothetical protein